MLTVDMKRMLLDQRLGFVATVCRDGTANLSPKGTIMPWAEDQLVFAHLYSPQTVENLRHNPSIEINVVDVFTRKGYRFKGTAAEIGSGPIFDSIMDLYVGDQKHDPLRDAKRRVKAFIMVTCTEIRELISPAYDDGTSEADIFCGVGRVLG